LDKSSSTKTFCRIHCTHVFCFTFSIPIYFYRNLIFLRHLTVHRRIPHRVGLRWFCIICVIPNGRRRKQKPRSVILYIIFFYVDVRKHHSGRGNNSIGECTTVFFFVFSTVKCCSISGRQYLFCLPPKGVWLYYNMDSTFLRSNAVVGSKSFLYFTRYEDSYYECRYFYVVVALQQNPFRF